MRHAAIALCLAFVVAGCTTTGQKGAEIEQRDLFDQGQAAQQAEQQRKAEAEKQAQILREQEELKRQLEEQQRRQQQSAQAGQGQAQGQTQGQAAGQAESPVIRPLSSGTVGEGQIGKDPWMQLKEPGSLLAQRSIYYDFDRYDIKEDYVPIVEAHAKFLVEHPDMKIVVQGNCDDRGSREYNLALGQRRADSVKRAMVLLGVNGNQIETVSFGAEKPIAFGQDEDSWAKNRRSDIVYVNEPK